MVCKYIEFSFDEKMNLPLSISGAIYGQVPAWVEAFINESFVSTEIPKSPNLALWPLLVRKILSGYIAQLVKEEHKKVHLEVTMNDFSVVTKFQRRSNLQRPFNNLFDIELLMKTSLFLNLISEISVGAIFHRQVKVVRLHLMIEITENRTRIC